MKGEAQIYFVETWSSLRIYLFNIPLGVLFLQVMLWLIFFLPCMWGIKKKKRILKTDSKRALAQESVFLLVTDLPLLQNSWASHASSLEKRLWYAEFDSMISKCLLALIICDSCFWSPDDSNVTSGCNQWSASLCSTSNNCLVYQLSQRNTDIGIFKAKRNKVITGCCFNLISYICISFCVCWIHILVFL